MIAGTDLFVVASGGNDVHFALSSLSGFTIPQQNAYIQDQATALAGVIKSLHLRGATHIIVVGNCLALITWPRTTPPFPVLPIPASCSKFTEFKSQHAPRFESGAPAVPRGGGGTAR